MTTILSTAQIEHGFPILAELDLTKLFDAFLILKANLPEGVLDSKEEGKILKAVAGSPELIRLVLPLLQTMGEIGTARILRRVSAVVRASDEDLLAAERSPSKLAELEAEAAKRSFLESGMDLIAFFARLGLSTTVSLPSLEGEEETEQGTSETEEPSESSPSEG